jgi:hypothetical protein
MSNSKTRKVFKSATTERAKVAQKHGIKLLVGPIFSINHKSIVVAEAPKVESLMEMLTELRVPQWNSVEVQPYMTAEEATKSIDATEALY